MVTITLHDKDAMALLAAAEEMFWKGIDRGVDPSGGQLKRAASAIRCALLLCDCAEPQATAP